MSLTEAGQRLGKDHRYVRGFADCMGIALEAWGTSLLMSREDFERLKQRVESQTPSDQAATTQ